MGIFSDDGGCRTCSLATYCYEVVVYKESVEEPRGGTKSEREWEHEWHVLNTSRPNYFPLHKWIVFWVKHEMSLLWRFLCVAIVLDIWWGFKNVTMMLRGAAKTARLITAQVHPTNSTLFWPFTKTSESTNTVPNPTMLNTDINFIVDICKRHCTDY